MVSRTDVAIVGAGPYGLSIAAHLNARNVDNHVFGSPMHFWATTMRSGRLKSEGFATDLSEPTGRFTLGAYCAEKGEPYAPIGMPIPFKTFTAYGMEFQRRFVPNLEVCNVANVGTTSDGFVLQLDTGRIVTARRVILATGVAPLAYTPPPLRGLPAEFRSHSSQYGDVEHLAGKQVVVVGAGASATDLAAHLVEARANVTIVTRRPELRFQTKHGERSVLAKLRAPITPLGPGWKSVLCVKAPLLFHVMPEGFRLGVVRRYLNASPAWFTRDRVEGRVDVVTGTEIEGADVAAGRVRLRVHTAGVGHHEILADHVVAATGYKVDIGCLGYLGDDIRGRLRCAPDRSPVLTRHFECSIPGLFFVGTAAANSFGPMLRFVCGVEFTARRLARHVARALRRPLPCSTKPAQSVDLAA